MFQSEDIYLFFTFARSFNKSHLRIRPSSQLRAKYFSEQFVRNSYVLYRDAWFEQCSIRNNVGEVSHDFWKSYSVSAEKITRIPGEMLNISFHRN